MPHRTQTVCVLYCRMMMGKHKAQIITNDAFAHEKSLQGQGIGSVLGRSLRRRGYATTRNTRFPP